MRLLVSRNSAEERLIAVLTEGYALRQHLIDDYNRRSADGTFSPESDIKRYRESQSTWFRRVQHELHAVFPTPLERHKFVAEPSHNWMGFVRMDQEFGELCFQQLPTYLERLQAIFDSDLCRYTDLPQQNRLFVEDVDSFSRVRDVNPAMVSHLVKDGRLDLLEDQVQSALEQILNVPYHEKDWGGELCDMYTANVVLNGTRRPAAFLLKGRGIRRKEMTIADCGTNGDQIVRLFTAPAELFVIQYVGRIAKLLIADAEGKVELLRGQDRNAHLLVIDGQDTARLLLAYGKLP